MVSTITLEFQKPPKQNALHCPILKLTFWINYAADKDGFEVWLFRFPLKRPCEPSIVKHALFNGVS